MAKYWESVTKDSSSNLVALILALVSGLLFALEIFALEAISVIIPGLIAYPLIIVILGSLVGSLYKPKLSAEISSVVIVSLIFSIYFTLPLISK